MVQDESHLCRVVSHRLGRDGGPGEVAVVGGLEQRPLANLLGEQALHDLRQLDHDLGVQFRVVNPPVGRADGDRAGVVERANSGHLHDGNLAVLGDGKFRPGKLERGIVIAYAQGGRALARDRPTAGDVGEPEQDGFLLLHPRVVDDRHVETFLKFARQEHQRAGSRLEIVALERGALGGCIVHAKDPVGGAGSLDGHDRVGAVHVFTDVEKHIGELQLTVVVPQREIDAIHRFRPGRDETAAIHADDAHLHILRELQLRVVQRDERHLDPVGPGRDDHLATQILVVGDGAGGAVHGQAHGHVPNRAGGHLRATRNHAAAVAAGVLVIAAEPGEALSRQPAGIPLEGVQHTVQRRDVKRPIRPDNCLGQRGAADVDLVLQLALGIDQEQFARRADAKHPLVHIHDGCARRDSQFVLPLQLARLVQGVDFSVCGTEEDVAKHIGDRLAKDHSPGIKGPLLRALLDTDQLVHRPGRRFFAAISAVSISAVSISAVSGRRISRLRLPSGPEINQVLVVHRRGTQHALTWQRVGPQRLAKRIQRMELGIVAGHENGVVGGDRRGGGHPAPRGIGPLDHAVLPDGIHLVIERADVDCAVRPDARGGTLHPGAKRGDPFQRAKGVQCIKFAVAGTDVNGAVQADRRGRRDGAPHLERPLHGSVRVDGIQVPGSGTDIDEAVRPDGRGGDHPGIALEFPLGRAGRHLDLEDHHPLGRPLFVDLR